METARKYFAVLVITVLVFGGVLSLVSFSQPAAQNQNNPQPQTQPTNATVDKLVIQDVHVGAGREAKSGNTVTVHYTGTFTDGRKFDSSYDHNQSFSFVLGAGQVIPGWDQGLPGMKVGGKRKLAIPPSLAYGARGAAGAIPPNSTLLFEVELLDVK